MTSIFALKSPVFTNYDNESKVINQLSSQQKTPTFP